MDDSDKKILQNLYPGSRMPGLKTKYHILECFMMCLSEHGIENISFEKIASASSLPKALVHYHFKSFYEMLDVATKIAIAKARASVREATNVDGSILDTLKSWADSNLDWAYKQPQWKSVFLLTIFRKGNTKKSTLFVEKTLGPAGAYLLPILNEKSPFKIENTKFEALITSIQHHIMGLYVCHPTLSPKKLSIVKKELSFHIQLQVQHLFLNETSRDD